MKFLLIAGLLTALAAAAIAVGKMRWHNDTAELFEALRADATTGNGRVDLTEVDTLPAPVQKYFRLVLQQNAPLISRVALVQSGGFRAKPEMPGWSKMDAQQHFSTVPRGFVWNASIAMLPGLSIKVCDSYRNGSAQMRGKVLSLFTLIDVGRQKELNEAALQRYLAEAVWFPTALLPSQGVSWSAIDDTHAKATVTDGANTVSLEFGFNDLGEIVSAYAPQRYREVNGTYEATPWKGRYGKYVDVSGYRIPSEAEVEWQLKEQTYPYWKATISQVAYD